MVVGFFQDCDEFFYCYFKVIWLFSVVQLVVVIVECCGSIVVVYDGQVFGFVNFYQWQYGDFCVFGNMMVVFVVCGLGVVCYLIGVMENFVCEQYKVCLMKIFCFNVNVVGLLFYIQFGYQLCVIVECYDLDGWCVVLIQMDKFFEF